MSGQVGQQHATLGGRYKVERLIARGGMGSVYLCQDTELPRRLALKVLEARSTGDGQERFEDRFRLEASTLAGLNHPNIVTLYDFGRMEDGRFFLALEYIDGPRFTDLIRTGPMPVDRAVRLLSQVCRALRYAHRRGVVHRDLKPSNLLVRVDEDGEEQVKVVDFGLVKVVDDQSITRAGLILGSPHCMAPEQVRGTEVDHRADIYALGVLLFRAVSGQWPFHGESSTSTMIAHVQQPVPRLAAVAPDLLFPEGLESILQRCLEKSPERRYPDAGALLDAFRVLGGIRDSFSGVETGSFSGVSLTGEAAPMVALASLPPVPPAQPAMNRVAGAPSGGGGSPAGPAPIAEARAPLPIQPASVPADNAATREEISSAVSMGPRETQQLPMWIFAAGAGVGLGLVGLALSVAIWWNSGSGEVQVVAPEAIQTTGEVPEGEAEEKGGGGQAQEVPEETPPKAAKGEQKAAPNPGAAAKPSTPAAPKPAPAKTNSGGTSGSNKTAGDVPPPAPASQPAPKEPAPSEPPKGDDKYLGSEAWPE